MKLTLPRKSFKTWAAAVTTSLVTKPGAKLVPELLPRITRIAMKRLGFQLELRRQGDLAIGLWRKTLRQPVGSKPERLVLVPGFGDTPLSWVLPMVTLNRQLRRTYDEWVVIDFPGFNGALGPEPAFDSMDLLLGATRSALASLDPTLILGHSLGGWITGDYAITRAPHSRLKQIILFAPSGHPGLPHEKAEWEGVFQNIMEQGFGPLRERVFGREPKWFALLADGFGQFVTRPDVLAFLRSVEDRHTLQGKLDQIPASGVRTTLFWGDMDRLTPFSWLESWKRELGRGAEYILIKNVGHNPQTEAPALTLKLLKPALQFKPVPARPTEENQPNRLSRWLKHDWETST